MTRRKLQFTKKLKGLYFTFAVLGGILLFSTQAQAVSYALTGFTYDTGAGMVYGTSQTYLDYDLDVYYNAGTDGILIKYNDASLSSYTILSSGSVDHPWDAVVLTAANVQRGETYAVFSDHFLETTLYYYGYPYDPYGISYNYFGEGGGSPYYGFQYWQSVIMQNVWFYLGRTGVIVSLPDITQLAPDAGVPGTAPTVQIIGKYIGEHTQIPPTVSVSGSGVTAQFANFLPNGVEVSLQISEDADIGDHAVSLTSDGVLSNSVNFRVGDRSPQITGISPADGIIGEQVAVTITGTGFGVNPQIQIDGSGVNPTITSATSTEIQAIFSIADLTYEGNRGITIRSNGWSGNGFISGGGNSDTSNSLGFTVFGPKVIINPSQTVKDGETASFNVTVQGGNPVSYLWTYEAPSNAGNNPNVPFSSVSSSDPTAVAKWFASPDQPCSPNTPTSTDPYYNSKYKVKVKVSFSSGQEITKDTDLTVNSYWAPAGSVAPPTITGGPAIGFDSTRNLWVVTGSGSLTRNLQARVINLSSASQFFTKTDEHEKVHENQFSSGLYADILAVSGLMSVISPLTDSTQAGLSTKVGNAAIAWYNSEEQRYNGKLSQAEREAYAVSDLINPQYAYQNCGRF